MFRGPEQWAGPGLKPEILELSLGASEVAEKSYRLGLRELGFRVFEACNSRYRTFGFAVLGLGSQETPLQDQSFGDVTGVGFFR